MCSNLANIYAYLLRKYEDNYMVTYASAPTYLNNIVGAAENPGKIILFYIEDRSTKNSTNFLSPSKLKIKKAADVDLELTGSPLKDECEVDILCDMTLDLNLVSSNSWKPEEEYHKGISTEKARSIIASEDFQNGAAARDAVGSVWFLCSGADVAKTLLLQYEFHRKHYTRGIIYYRGIIPAHAVVVSSLLQEHYNLAGRDARIETQIENSYNIKSNILLKCCWSTASTTPSLVDLRTCDVYLKQTFYFNDSGSSTKDFINQLRILMTIRDEIISYKQFENSDVPKEPTYSSGIGIDMVELRENINKVMVEIAEIDASSGAERDIEDVIQNAKIRGLNDLTDKLWEILKRKYDCSQR